METLTDPFGFLDELVPFAQRVFEELPPDSSLTLGQTNETRVFLIKLLSKFKYDGYHGRGILPMIYGLLQSENIFNRYLTLRILFPLLEADLAVDLPVHLRAVNSFFRNELPTQDALDISRCELGFFASSEALHYLRCFQTKYNLGSDAYEEIFFSIAAALKIYLTQKYMDRYGPNKKIVCEFCSMAIELLDFISTLSLPTSHFIIPFIPELCYMLFSIVPSDCYYLRKDALASISRYLCTRKDIFYSMDRYFLKSSPLAIDYAPLSICTIGFLCDILVAFSKSMTKITLGEFDLRMCECLPANKNLPLLHACCSAFAINLSLMMRCPIDPSELRPLVLKQVRNAYRVYKLLHLPLTKPHEELADFKSPECTESEVAAKLMEYTKVVVRSLASLAKPLEPDDVLLLGQLLLFPLSRAQCSREFYAAFLELPMDDLKKVVDLVAEDLILKYHQKSLVWGILAQNPEINCVLVRQACHVIHGDLMAFTYRSIDFYQKVFPLAYGYFKIDKKYARAEFSEYFSVIFDYVLHYSQPRDCSITEKEMIGLIDSMFLEIKGCEVAYTGLYFIYSHFEETVAELYTLYNQSFDPFFLECLFNIPVSLNLLVTKYVVLIDPMAAGLQLGKRLREIVLKYIEYIIEFDNEEGLMDALLLTIFQMLQDLKIKGINVLSRISNKHRTSLCRGRVKDFVPMDTDEIFCLSSMPLKQDGYTFVGHGDLDAGDVEGLLSDGNPATACRSESRSDCFRIGADGLYRAMIKNLSGFEFAFESCQRQSSYSYSISRSLRVVDVDPVSREYARDVLLEYIIALLGFKELSLSSDPEGCCSNMLPVFCLFTNKVHPECQLGYYQRIQQTVSDILLAFLIDDNERTLGFLKLCMRVYAALGHTSCGKQVFVDVLADGLVYSGVRTMDVLKFLVKSIDRYDSKIDVVSSVLYMLIDLVYSKDDMKSHRALCAILDIHEHIDLEMSPSPSRDIFHCLYFKLRKCQSYRLYNLCLRISIKLFERYGQEGRESFELVFERGCSPYGRALHIEAEYLFSLNVYSSMLPEVDKRILLRILNFGRTMLARFTNLVSISESLLRGIDRRDVFAIRQYTSFLDSMAGNSLFNELLVPTKKYLPAVAVLEGFPTMEARRKFVESVNRNSNFHIQSSGSFWVFRNLFHSCRISSGIKASFIEAYPAQSPEYKMVILDILVNSLDYDMASFDFVMERLSDFPVVRADIPSGLSPECARIFKMLRQRMLSQQQPVRESILRYLMEHMHLPVVFHFADMCIPITSEITLLLTSLLGEYLNSSHAYRGQQILSRAAYNALRYLKRKKCRFNDSKAVLLVYRDLSGIEHGVDALVNWYFKNFSAEDIEVLYRLDSSFLITSESLLSKIVSSEPGPTKTWMLGCFRKHLSCAVGNEHDSHGSFVDRCISFHLKSASGEVESLSSAFVNGPESESADSETSVCQSGLSISGSDLDEETSLFHGCESSECSVDLFTKSPVDRKVAIPDTRDETANEEEESSHILEKATKRCRTSSTLVSRSDHTEPHDLTFLLVSFADSILPVLEMFCDMKIYNKVLAEMCKKNLSSPHRYASLYYLCLFDPSPEYFELVFKLSYHERKYALSSLLALVDRFGPDPFVDTVKTVIRSEMRFRTSEYVLIPLLLSKRAMLERKDILFELCVLTHRLFRMGHLNYELLSAINMSSVSAVFKRELNTIVMIKELETGRHVILGKERDNDMKKVVLTIIRGPNRSRVLDPCFGDIDFDSLGLKKDIVAIVASNKMVTLPKKMIAWIGIPPEAYLGSTLDNQVSALEVCADCLDTHRPSADVVMGLLRNVVAGRYSHFSRFGIVYRKLIRLFPIRISSFLLDTLRSGELAYPPLLEYLPEVLELSEPEVAVRLAAIRPSNIPLDVFESNILHLFKVMPFSLNALKKEFFEGLMSRNKITRKCYFDMLLTYTPSGIFDTLQHIMLFNYSGLEDDQIESFIAVLLYRALSLRDPVIPVPLLSGPSNSGGKVHWYEFVSPKRNLFKYDLLYYSLEKQESIRCFLEGIFRKLDRNNLHSLYRMYRSSFSSNSMRIRMPFMRAFSLEGVKVNDLLYDPHHPSLKFYEIVDRPMYLGLAKSRAGLRETKEIIEAISSGQGGEQRILDSVHDLIKMIDTRQVSYNSEDVHILESEVARIYTENGQVPKRKTGPIIHFCSSMSHSVDDIAGMEAIFSSSIAETTEVELVEEKFSALVDTIWTERTSMDEVTSLLSDLSVLFYVPRSSPVFSTLLMLSSIASEMVESSIILKDNLSDSIYGRFRMWMIRHPSFLCPFSDWSVFMKWRSFIFSNAAELVSENDRKKISSEMCRLNCIYATKAFKEKLHQKSSFILNEMFSITTVEISQNMQRVLLDLENLYALGDYSTMVSLINSLNITRFSNEDKSRLYFWAYKAFKNLGKGPDSERFGSLSRRLFDIVENKKEDLKVLKEKLKKSRQQVTYGAQPAASKDSGVLGDGLVFALASKLVEIINECSVEDSRPYVIQLMQTDPSRLEHVSHQKLYFFIPQIGNPEFLFAKNPLLRSSTNAVEIFNTLSTDCDSDSLWNRKELLHKRLRENASADDVGKLAADVFGRELRSMFTRTKMHSIHSFEKETALPGEFLGLRTKYDDIRTMEYIEDFCPGSSVFLVRNTDGSLCRIVVTHGKSDFAMMQFMQLASARAKNHTLDKLFFGLCSIPTVNASDGTKCFSVHKSLDHTVDSLIKLQLFKKNMPMESIVTRYLDARQRASKLSAFVDSVMYWKDLFKNEVLERVIDFNDFYLFKRNFISSYSTLACLQYILGCCCISLEDLYVERCSGLAYLRTVSRTRGKFYLRPNLSTMFGTEGLNGPLCMILRELCRSFRSDGIEEMVYFFFGDEMKDGIEERIAVADGKTATPQMAVGEMIDPRAGAVLCSSLMPWL